MKKRVYVIEYEIQTNVFSLDPPKMETKTGYYPRNERDKFIERYYELKNKYYVNNLKTYFAELDEINVEDIVNSI